MKISNETKVGALTAIAITVLILGFNFLKGKSARGKEVFAVFPNVEKLVVSNPVKINGLQVGKVTDLQEIDKNMSGILVTLTLTKDLNIPKNSVAVLNAELLGSGEVDIHLGNGSNYVQEGDTLRTERTLGLTDRFQKSLDPAINNINKTLLSLDEVLQKLNTVLDPNTRNNLQGIIANLAMSSRSLEQLLNTESGMLAKSIGNLNVITSNFARNGPKIDSTFTNLQIATDKLSKAKIAEAIESMQRTMARLEAGIAKIDSKEGTVGLLLNDRKLYDEIRLTNRSLTILLDDLRVNPKRYINISLFGSKDKRGPLKAPLDTLK
ncbi:MlaD family protein [Niastella populi]|uniref:Mammalian cell entry protein n=1 Tax=Niastella populi TaxID=550983 RepID=A0A1V9G4V6_9BACT|nr:MlaD family protein [Niastella populi]OQP65584.1 mammalian cell entry protein [Niastella populi]